MLAPRRGCLGYSKVYCDVRKRWFLAWNQNRHIKYYIFHIQYTNSKISIGLLYIRPHFVWHRLNHLCGFSPKFADFHFGPCLGKFVDIQYVNHFGAIIVYELPDFAADSSTFLFPRCPTKLSNSIERSQ